MKKVIAIVCVALALCGCYTKNAGSYTVVGEHTMLPELSDAGDNIAVRIYQSVEGAKVWTAKNSIVKIRYDNSYTNTYAGVIEKIGKMGLEVEINPVENDSEPCGNAPKNDIILPEAIPKDGDEILTGGA